MRALLWVALKDLRRLVRRPSDAFFVFLFPVVYAAFFTQVVSGSAAGASQIRLAVVDEDQSPLSARLVARLRAEDGLKLAQLERDEAAASVRGGRRAAYLVLPAGFGAAERPRLTLAADPARQGEAELLRGLLLRIGGELLGERIEARVAQAREQVESAQVEARERAERAFAAHAELAARLEEALSRERAGRGAKPAEPRSAGLAPARPAPVDSAVGAAKIDWGALDPGEPLAVDDQEVSGTRERAPVPAAVTLPQGTVWALLACAAAFGATLVGERTTGTLRRLRMAPVGVLPVLLGKGLACFVTILGVCSLLLGGVAPLFGVEVARYDLLALAVVCSGVCYCGLMLLIGTIGGSEDAAYRIGWALILVLAMLGGAMVPSYLMPGWMEGLSRISPVRWSLLALEGAIWRGFSLRDMALPCGVLVGMGLGCFALGSALLRVRLARGWSK